MVSVLAAMSKSIETFFNQNVDVLEKSGKVSILNNLKLFGAFASSKF